MNIEHDDPGLEKVEFDQSATVGHGDAVDKGFRKVMQVIRSAIDERDIRAMRSLRFEKLIGNRRNHCSLRINKQGRLIIKIRKENRNKKVIIISVEDYH